jgi:hypothetical protein
MTGVISVARDRVTLHGRLRWTDLELVAWVAVYAVLPFVFSTGLGLICTAFFVMWAIAWRTPYHREPWRFRFVALAGVLAMWIVAFGLLWMLASMLPPISSD